MAYEETQFLCLYITKFIYFYLIVFIKISNWELLVSLPLKLAVALLKDADGKIKIDVPITGSLDDPKFSVGAIVTDALINVLSKVITSPFRALAALIGSEEDMSTIGFPAGNSY